MGIMLVASYAVDLLVVNDPSGRTSGGGQRAGLARSRSHICRAFQKQGTADVRVLQGASAFSLFIGVPLGFTEALGPLAEAWIYIEPPVLATVASQETEDLARVAGFASTITVDQVTLPTALGTAVSVGAAWMMLRVSARRRPPSSSIPGL